MKILKKNNIVTIILIVVIMLLFFGLSRFIIGPEDISVKSLNAEIIVDENGNIDVREKWVIRWPEDMSVFFRDIGYGKYDERNPLYQKETNVANFDEDNVSVKVYDENQNQLSADDYRVGYSFRNDIDERDNLLPQEPNSETVFIHVYNGMESEMTFEYNYRILGAVTLYRDTAELNWKLFEYFGTEITEANVIVKTPTPPTEAWGHGLARGTVKLENDRVLFEMGKIEKGELLEFRILMAPQAFTVNPVNYLDVGIHDDIMDYEYQLAKSTNSRITVARIVYYGTYAMILIMIGFTYFAYKKYDKEHQPKFTGRYYRDLPADYSPAEMSYLYYFRKINNEDVTATLLDLIRRKYLILDSIGEKVTEKNPDFKIKINENHKDYTELLPHERHIIDWFVKMCGNGKEVSIKQIEAYPKKSYKNAQNFSRMAKNFINMAKAAGKKHDFFEKGLSANKGKLYAVLIIPLLYLLISYFTGVTLLINNNFAIIISIVVMFAYGIYISTIDKRSLNGNEDYVKWKAYRAFMLDFGRMKDYPMPGLVVWEKYLVYATSLKIADLVMKQLEVKLPSEGVDLQGATYLHFGYRYYGFNLGYTLGRINTSLTTARTNMNSVIMSHHSQKVGSFTKGGGIGRGGGFGGGRSFGGGGGGIRGR